MQQHQHQHQHNPYGPPQYTGYSPQPAGPVDNLINIYLNQEGIDRRYYQLILQELHDATDMTNDQLNQAANEIMNKSTAMPPPAAMLRSQTPLTQVNKVNENNNTQNNNPYV